MCENSSTNQNHHISPISDHRCSQCYKLYIHVYIHVDIDTYLCMYPRGNSEIISL